ncbi:MAG: RNase adapter RapZ [Elusimicrobia bacterium]|jgi:UPF0042 nucleotide-binding protein|nr:RNase adapter RapZ [Elusimicrobiota bacterium]
MKNFKNPRLFIITGLSGAGKSVAIKALEDFNGYCVDNMPPALIKKFLSLIKSSDYSGPFTGLGIDIRSQGKIDKIFRILPDINKINYSYKIIYLEASNRTLIRRFSESRRRHPLADSGGRIAETIDTERHRMQPIKENADVVLDTSRLNPHELKNRLKEIIFKGKKVQLSINLIAFGFKYGVPPDIDMVIDTRFLPNPHYEPGLSAKTGLEKEIKEYVLKGALAKEFVKRYQDLIKFLIPNYEKEGKAYFNIGVGCTGGRHRSVVIADALADFIRNAGYSAGRTYRDIEK